MKSKTTINNQIRKKTNKELVETIIIAKKNNNWFKVAEILSGPRRKRTNMNLEQIDKKTDKEEIVVILGKVLSQGEINKKIEVVALDFSKKAKEKLLKANCKISSIIGEIKKNPKAERIKILK